MVHKARAAVVTRAASRALRTCLAMGCTLGCVVCSRCRTFVAAPHAWSPVPWPPWAGSRQQRSSLTETSYVPVGAPGCICGGDGACVWARWLSFVLDLVRVHSACGLGSALVSGLVRWSAAVALALVLCVSLSLSCPGSCALSLFPELSTFPSRPARGTSII